MCLFLCCVFHSLLYASFDLYFVVSSLLVFFVFFVVCSYFFFFFFFKQKTAYEMRISDWSSDVCSSDLNPSARTPTLHRPGIVRTDQRLGDYFRDAEILQRSRYYHEWLQPQDFAHTMGVTPLAEDGIVFNLSQIGRAHV